MPRGTEMPGSPLLTLKSDLSCLAWGFGGNAQFAEFTEPHRRFGFEFFWSCPKVFLTLSENIPYSILFQETN